MSASELLGYVFGYGTLADPNDWLIVRGDGRFPEPTYLHVLGYRRHWDMASDNLHPRHDNKYHAEADTGERSDIRVVSLTLEESLGTRCNGVAVPVDEERLRWFDQREGKLYTRELIPPERIDADLDMPLWSYFATPQSLAAFEAGMAEGNVYCPAYYVRMMDEVYGARGPEALADYRSSTREPRCPVRELVLVRAQGDLGI